MKWIWVCAAFLLFSCDKNTVYKQFDSGFEENRWQRDDTRVYEFALEQTANYDLYIDFSYAAEVQFAQIPVTIEISSPDGQVREMPITIETKDQQGKEAGDCAGDYCDLRQIVFSNKNLAAGSYKIRLRNRFENSYLPNVIGIGVRLKHAE